MRTRENVGATMRMLSIGDLLGYLAVSRTKFFELRRDHAFPQPALHIGKLQRWDVRDVDLWLDQQRQQRAAQGKA